MKRKADEEAAAARKKEKKEREEKELQERINVFTAEASKEDEEDVAPEVEDADSSFHHDQTDRELGTSTQNRIKLDNAAMQAIRTGTSPATAACIITGAFVDAGIVTKEDPANICLKSKLQRAIERVREEYEVKDEID